MMKQMTRRVLALGLAVLWLPVSAADAQVEETWVARYDGPSTLGLSPSDWVNDLEVSDGYVYVTGYESAFFGSAYATVKYDDTGQEIWVQRLDDGQSQHAEALAVDAAGNVYVTGWQKQFSAGIDAVTLKYGPDGDVLWERHFASPGGNNQPNDMALDASGNLYVAGASWVTAQQDFDMLLLKYDSDGNLLWDRTLDNGDGQLDSAYRVVIDSAGNAILAGYTEPNAYLAKYSPTGDLLWDREKAGFSTNDEWKEVEVDAAGNIYVLGEISPPGQSNHLWTAKYDPDGNIVWERSYTGTQSFACYAGGVALMPDGGVVISGQSWDLPNNINIVTIRYGPDGTELWQRLENGGYAHASGDDVAVDAEGRVYVTGYGYDFSFWEDIITLSYTPDGDLRWTEIYAGLEPDQSDYPQVMALDEASNVFIAASSWDPATSNDFTTIRYTQEFLGADASTFSAGGADTLDLTLDAGPAHAARSYFLLATLSGTSPGFSLPGGTTLPLNWDAFTTAMYGLVGTPYLVDFQGTLDGTGQAEAQLNTFGPLPVSYVGMKMHLAYTLYAPFDFVSNAVGIDFVN